MKISEWVKTPKALGMERNYKELGIIEQDSYWDRFQFIESITSCEEYLRKSGSMLYEVPGRRITKKGNKVYLRSGEGIYHLIMALRVAAEATKLEGYEMGGGDLVVQERLAISERDTATLWYGAIYRIDSNLIRGPINDTTRA